jgi:hypothetical protein
MPTWSQALRNISVVLRKNRFESFDQITPKSSPFKFGWIHPRILNGTGNTQV